MSSKDGTFGQMEYEGKIICHTCEDPWNDNKVGISCIPPATYTVANYSGTRYKDVWIVQKVPNSTAILIHNGNTPRDTEGCILVGDAFMIGGKKTIGVTNSVKTLEMLRGILPDTFSLWIRGK
jgi:hypothetical protein